MLTFMLLFATPLVAVGEALVNTGGLRQELEGELFSLIPNPYLALGSAVLHPLEANSVLTPFGPVHAYLLVREEGDTNFGGGVAANLIVEQDGHRFVRLTRPPFWVYSALFYVGLSVLAIRRATRWVTTPSPNEFALRRGRDTRV
jgi:hypothetical protein